jgi:hypothetical protein
MNMNPIQIAQEHLQKSKKTYFNHLYHASMLGLVLIYAGIASIIHALLPCFFAAYSANKVTRIFYRVVYTSANPDIQGYRKQEAVLAENTNLNKW